jgi:hypothetical protein
MSPRAFLSASGKGIRMCDPLIQLDRLNDTLLRRNERKGQAGSNHILGDLLRRRGRAAEGDRSLLRVACTAVTALWVRAARELGAGKT